MKKAIVWGIIGIISVVFMVYIYSNTINHKCPYCGSCMEYGEKVIKDGTTMYRYYCTKNSWHMVDLYVKVNDSQ